MQIERTAISEVLILTPRRFSDARGWFSETWSARAFAEIGLPTVFAQDNHSHSIRTGTVRGLHAQRPPLAQGKLVRVARGRIRDVAVDARPGSPTYGRWAAAELSAENGAQLWIPTGFLHGFVTLEPHTDVVYKADAPYDAAAEIAVRFDDPDLAIDWGIDPSVAVLSDKDARALSFRDLGASMVEERRP